MGITESGGTLIARIMGTLTRETGKEGLLVPPGGISLHQDYE